MANQDPKKQALVQSQENFKDLRSLLMASKTKIEDVVPKHLTVDRLLRVALATASKPEKNGEPNKLLFCDRQSFLLAVMELARIGIEPGGPLGHGYLIPFAGAVVPVVGYRGYIALARRSGEIASITARVVHAKDEWVHVEGLEPILRHRPTEDDNPGDWLRVYAVARLVNGGVQHEVMRRGEVEAIRDRVMRSRKNTSDSPWTTDPEEMARKTVVRRLAKYLPLSVELAEAIDLDQRGDNTFGSVIDTEVVETPAAGATQAEREAEELRRRRAKRQPAQVAAPSSPPPEEPPPREPEPWNEPAEDREQDGGI